MNIQTGFDAENSRLVISFNTNLLLKYYPNFYGLLNKETQVPSGLSISKSGKNTALITFPVGKGQIGDKENDRVYLAIDKNKLTNIMNVINRFITGAIRKELNTTEFLPLEGYPEGDIKTDVVKAVEGKRNFCIIDTYENYLKQCKDREYNYNQYMVEYGTDEYYDVAIMIETGEFKDLVEKYKSKLDKTSWL
jgi:hypothetical protein